MNFSKKQISENQCGTETKAVSFIISDTRLLRLKFWSRAKVERTIKKDNIIAVKYELFSISNMK